jgi:hemerythrin-like domain-containing protein
MSFIKAKPQARYDFYGKIHKGLRLAQSQLLVRLGACGGDDAVELALLLADLAGFLGMAEHHLENEDRWIHTALEARAPGAARGLAQDHAHHHHAFEELKTLMSGVRAADGENRARALHLLYLRFSRFMAADLEHMAEEEQLILPVLQSLFTDEELMGVEGEIVSRLDLDETIAFARLMIPASNPAERVDWAAGMRAAAPPEVFDAVMSLAAQPSLTPAAYAQLREGLGLEPAQAELSWGRTRS